MTSKPDASMSIFEEVESRKKTFDNKFSIHLKGTRHGRSSMELARQVALEVIKSVETLDNRIYEEIALTSDEANSICDLLVEASKVMDLVAMRLKLDLDAEDGGTSAAAKSEEAGTDFALYCSYEDTVRELIENNGVLVSALEVESEAFILA